MNAYDDVLVAAQGLLPSERIRLIQALWDTAPPEQWPTPSDEWIAEARRRSAEFDAGQLTASPWSEVRACARHKAGLNE